MKRNLLFVTDTSGNIEEGLTYVLELAKMIDKGVTVLMVRRKRLSERFDDLMTAITFAEAGEHETAREYLGAGAAHGPEERLRNMEDICRRSGVAPTIHATTEDAQTAIGRFLRGNSGIEMVLLSPSMTAGGGLTPRTIGRMLRRASMPIVTLSRNPHLA